jgi:hypothetical protein
VKEKRDIFASNYLEAGVPDDVNPADKPVVNDDDTPESTQNRPQKVANVISFSALSNMHTKLGHASAEAMLRFLEGGIIPARVVFCRPDQCSLTNSYVDNNSSLISE